MFSSRVSLVFTALVLLLGNPILAQLPKAVLFNDGLSPHVEASFWANLKPVESTFSFWTLNDIPQKCKDEAIYLGFNPADFDIYSIKYTDCGMSWAICRHKQAVLNILVYRRPSITDLFGRIPVHERQWIQHVVAVPANPGSWAYFRSSVVVFVGNVGVPSVFQHEIGHAMDAYNNAVGSSGTTQWDQAIRNDTCVPDDYSNTSKVEDYAQNSVLLLYEIVTPGGLDKIGSWRCLQWQYRSVKAFQRPATIPGGTCERRWPDSPKVSKSGTALLKTVSAASATLEASEFAEDSSVVVSEQPPVDNTEPEVHVFKNLVFNKAEELAAAKREEHWDRKARIKRSHMARAAFE